MNMNLNSLKNKTEWQNAGVTLPEFDVKEVIESTRKNPKWVHFGAGNIFRGFIGKINQQILNCGGQTSGIIACDTFDYDIIYKIYHPYDNLTMLVNLKSDGELKKEIIASITDSYALSTQDEEVMAHMADIFSNESVQIVSLTITEKGYAIKDTNGNYLGIINQDMKNDPSQAKHVMSILTYLMLIRYNSGKLPIALVSMDNCSNNGDKLKEAVLDIAQKWCDAGKVSEEFLAYLDDESKVAFPISMIDKITPRPAKSVQEHLLQCGIENMAPLVTSVNTFIAPYVNAEVPQYLVIEDKFPNGRPELEKGGVYITDRQTVTKCETMKVTTCLNPLHTALSVYGCLLGYNRVYKEMQDAEIKKLVEKIGYDEGMKVVVDPKIINPEQFIKEVIEERFANPNVPDEPQRIVTDTSQKVGIRFGETIKSYIESDTLDVNELVGIPLAIAGWLRYLLAVDDELNEMQLSGDPLMEELQSILSSVKVGGAYGGEILPILSNKSIFGVDLVQCGLSVKIEEMFIKLIAKKGAVRQTLKEYLA